MLPWYICCFFVKHSGRPAITILTTSAQRERRNNGACLNLLKLFFGGSAFAAYLAGAAKLFLVIVSETYFWYLKSRLSTNSLHFIRCTSGTESTNASSFSLYLMPDPTLINQSSKEWIDWEQSSNDGGIIFPKHSIVHWIMVVVRGFILVDTYLRVFCSRPVLNVPEFWVLRSPICSVTSRLPNLIHT